MIAVWVALENEAPVLNPDAGDSVELVCQWGSAQDLPEELLSTVPGATLTPIAGGVYLASSDTDRFHAIALGERSEYLAEDFFPGVAYQDRYLPELVSVAPTLSGLVVGRCTLWRRQRGYSEGPRLLVQQSGAPAPPNYVAPQAMIRVDLT